MRYTMLRGLIIKSSLNEKFPQFKISKNVISAVLIIGHCACFAVCNNIVFRVHGINRITIISIFNWQMGGNSHIIWIDQENHCTNDWFNLWSHKHTNQNENNDRTIWWEITLKNLNSKLSLLLFTICDEFN